MEQQPKNNNQQTNVVAEFKPATGQSIEPKPQKKHLNKKTRTILLASLIPVGVLGVAAAITAPIAINLNKKQIVAVELSDQLKEKGVTLVSYDCHTYQKSKIVLNLPTNKIILSLRLEIGNKIINPSNFTINNGEIIISSLAMSEIKTDDMVIRVQDAELCEISDIKEIKVECTKSAYCVKEFLKSSDLTVKATVGTEEVDLQWNTSYIIMAGSKTVSSFDDPGYLFTEDDYKADPKTKTFEIKFKQNQEIKTSFTVEVKPAPIEKIEMNYNETSTHYESNKDGKSLFSHTNYNFSFVVGETSAHVLKTPSVFYINSITETETKLAQIDSSKIVIKINDEELAKEKYTFADNKITFDASVSFVITDTVSIVLQTTETYAKCIAIAETK